MSLTTLSQLIFASPYRALLYLVSLRSQLIFSLRYFVYIYIIKLSYYRVRFCFNIEPLIHSFICLTSFSTAFYPRSHFLPSLPLSLSLLLTLLRPRAHSLYHRFRFFFFFTLFKRECPYLRRHFAACLKVTKAHTRDYEIVRPIVSPRTRSCFARVARRDAREWSAEPAL